MKRYRIEACYEAKRYSDVFETEIINGEWVKNEDVEQLQALTKRFAEGIVLQIEHGAEIDLWSKEYIEAQQYLDSLKESV